MKRYIWPVLFLSLFIFAISCTESSSDLEVIAASPDPEAVFTYLSASLTQDGRTIESGSDDGTFIYPKLHSGKAHIEISAVDDVSGEEYTAESDMDLQIGPNQVILEMHRTRPEKKDMVLHFQDGDILGATLRKSGSSRIIFSDVVVRNGMLTLSDLSYGNYRITVRRSMNGETRNFSYEFTCSEKSPSEILFMDQAGTPGKGDVKLDFFDMTTSPIEGRIRIRDRGETLLLEMEIEKIDREIEERDLEFLWFQDGTYRDSGRTLEIEKKAGTIRFDCFIKSRFIGSYGSESISISISR